MPIRIAQYGTKHGHAAGKLTALRANPRVELAGVYEPDAQQRRLLAEQPPYGGVRWYASADELLSDREVLAVAVEGRNDESLAQAEQCLSAGKHVWYDKPAGEALEQWRRALATAERAGLAVQMGYMFRYHDGFQRIADMARQGALGHIFKIRAQMSTWISLEARQVIARLQGGILYDLAGHMLDQIVWILGRPEQITAALRNDDGPPGFADNTLAVLTFAQAVALVDIAAMEPPPPARRFEVYGDQGSAIMEPFEPAGDIRLCLRRPWGEFTAGEQRIAVAPQSRQGLYDLELEHFLDTLQGIRPPARSFAHDLLVQETLLRAVTSAEL
jgi:predicted dehydrogenase